MQCSPSCARASELTDDLAGALRSPLWACPTPLARRISATPRRAALSPSLWALPSGLVDKRPSPCRATRVCSVQYPVCESILPFSLCSASVRVSLHVLTARDAQRYALLTSIDAQYKPGSALARPWGNQIVLSPVNQEAPVHLCYSEGRRKRQGQVIGSGEEKLACDAYNYSIRPATSLRLASFSAMPYASPLASPASSTIVTPVGSPQASRLHNTASSHWGQPFDSVTNNGLPLRRHSRSHSSDGLSSLSPLTTTQIFLQPSSPLGETGPVPPSSAAAALNASHEHPPPPVSPRSSPSAVRLKLSPTSSDGRDSIASEAPSTEWPEGDPAEPSSPVASTSKLPALGNGSPPSRPSTSFQAPGTTEERRLSPPRLHLRGAAARSRTSPAVPLSALKKSVEKLAEQQRASHPVAAAPMIRKKSGELVRSSLKGHSGSSSRLSSYNGGDTPHLTISTTSGGGISPTGTRESRSKSVPATPSERKHVLFDENLEHIKLFRSEQRPTAVSRTGSPTETETEEESEGFPFPPMASVSGKVSIRCPDLPSGALSDADHRDVALEKLEMSVDQRNLRGTVQVRNLSLHKRVVVRFTTDDWQTVSETACEYVTAARGGGFDRWAFTIKLQDLLARIETTRLLLVIRYNTDGRELWDNNHNRNYCVQFKREAPPQPTTRKQVASSIRAAQTERYKFAVDDGQGDASERMAYLKRELDRLVAESDDTITPPTISSSPSMFAQRYDFSTSFKREKTKSAPAAPQSALLQNPFFHPLSGTGSPSASPLMSPAPSQSGMSVPPSYQPAQPLYQRREHNGVISTDYGLPAYSIESFPHRRASTPPDDDSKGPHSPYAREAEEHDPTTPRAQARFNSFPPLRNPKADYMSLLMAPRPTKGSPPAGSPVETPSETPSDSMTPQSDGAQSPRDSFTDLPALSADTAAKVEAMFSPSNSSLETEHSSPESPARSGSPPSSTNSPEASHGRGLEDGAPSYSSFLERYCWHNSSQPSALGLTDIPRQLPQPAPMRSTTPAFFLGTTSGEASPEDEQHGGLYSRHRAMQLTPLADARG